MITNSSDESGGDSSFRCRCEMPAGRERVLGIVLKHESLPGVKEVGGHDRDKQYFLSTYYSSTL